MSGSNGISSFSVLLLMVVTAVVGIACLSQLKVQYTPSASGKSITVGYSYPGASARVVESEVTSVLEGSLANISSCISVSSMSRDGSGYVSLQFGKKADMQAVRFEVSSRIRNVWTSLPEGCYYPYISQGTEESATRTAIAFEILSPLPSKEIARVVKDRIIHPLSTIEGVSDVGFYGDTPFEWVIIFDADKAAALGITAAEIREAVASYYSESILGMVNSGGNSYGVRFRNTTEKGADFYSIPVKNSDGRIVLLGEISEAQYQEALPDSYYRINGLNTLELAVAASSDANLLGVVRNVKEKMEEIETTLPEEISISIGYDASEYIGNELDKIYFRTGICLLILLLFVFIVNRSWRYMAVIALTLAANIFISAALYFLFGVHIHIYTLAGITVSLGIIIDNSIVMIDHWTRCHNRSVFPALLSAVLTTVAALLVILLLPEREKENLTDFTLVIVINLCVSLAVAYLFVPALLDYLPVRSSESAVPVRRLRRMARFNGRYERFINWGRAHKWVFVVAFILAFGIPTCFLPDNFGKEKDGILHKYSSNRYRIDKAIGSTSALFKEALSRSDFYREPERQSLNIVAGMPEGCTVQQLNEVMKSMENYLAHFDEVEVFLTSIGSARRGFINVFFKPEFENSWIPAKIKGEIISMAANFGGANWVVSGLDDRYFNNNIVTDSKGYGISLSGYNYDDLVYYGDKLVSYLSGKKRIQQPEMWGSEYSDRPQTEFVVNYDREAITALGMNPYSYYSTLYSPLFSSSVMQLPGDGEYVNVRLESSAKDSFDIWNVNNTAVETGNGKIKLSSVGDIRKIRSDFPIRKEDQSYNVTVRFNFIGSGNLAQKEIKKAVDYMNQQVLPVGYKASTEEYRWFYENQNKYAGLILLVIAIIFVICATHFNSLRYPLAIIWMIPIAFIGLFLAFGLTRVTFDKGGFAAFVMLSGITVNAGIYLVSAWLQEGSSRGPVRRYIKAFDKKIWPISLTILSTILGLVPFLFDGPTEVFWFSFAIGTIAGMFFSIMAFILYLPVFCLK